MLDPNFVASHFKLTCKDVAEALREKYHTMQLRGEPRVLESADDHHAPSLDAALARCGMVIEAEALVSAAAAGDLQACRRVFEAEGCNIRLDMVTTAAGLSGSPAVCEWLVEAMPHPYAWDVVLLPAAILAGHERVVEWALARSEDDHDCSNAWIGAAAKAGRLELMQRLAARYPIGWTAQFGNPAVLAQVAFGCTLAVLQQYYETWGTGLLEGIGQKQYLLLAAAGSPTPDWAEKCDWLWARWGTAAAAFATHNAELCRFLPSDLEIAGVIQHTDGSQRLQLLASRGLGSYLERNTPGAAGAIGSTAAVEFCLDQLPVLLRQRVAAPVVAAGGEGPAAAGAGGLLPAEDPAAQQQQQMNEYMDLIVLDAAKRGHVPVLRLLRRRGFVFRTCHLRAALGHLVWDHYHQASVLASLRCLLLEDPAGLAQDSVAAAAYRTAYGSSLLFDAAVAGADLPLLRVLNEQLGAPIDLVAVARGGSEEALSWAVAALEAAGQAPGPLSCSDVAKVLSSGNWAAADWLVRHGLAPPKQELLSHILMGAPGFIRIPDLQWVVGVHGGQDRAQAQVQWTAELHAALMQLRSPGNKKLHYDSPTRIRWLVELVEAVAAELAAAAAGGAPAGAGRSATS
ncbi:hypothetical protein HXX76_015204 [Chlamydomonas incerta]|uniref:Uncharacterized protein n=1 Tax=Chlamydomonas incerta TaxID=51695 RepID=A0A835SAV8_CHLIN|nr:hypothetical protein HXX76_015204 [Chlamydomonas incerta]|eukprot:KAG2423564.1 hypothetical protein HXX76_015204 [Chlamydomonas incerta]